MASLIVLYTKPDDVEGFEAYYRDTHTAIAKALPNLKGVSSSRITGTPRGTEAAYYLKSELLFDSVEDLSSALRGEEGQNTSRDAMQMCQTYGCSAEIMLAEDL